MSSNERDADLGIEITDEVEDDWQRRQYLNQIYEAWSETHEILREAAISPNRHSQKLAVEAVCSLIRVCRPMMQGRPVWDEKPVGQVTIGERLNGQIDTNAKQLGGLGSVLAFEDGYLSVEHVEAPGNTTATEKRLERRNLPLSIVRRAFDMLTKELYDRDILKDTSGEAEAKDRGGV